MRAIDIGDPSHPEEIAHLIPSVTAATEATCSEGGMFGDFSKDCAVVIQTNNVVADDRGYIYLMD